MAAQDRDSGTESIEDTSSVHGASYNGKPQTGICTCTGLESKLNKTLTLIKCAGL